MVALATLAVVVDRSSGLSISLVGASKGCTLTARELLCWSAGHSVALDANNNLATTSRQNGTNCSASMGLLTSVNQTTGATTYNHYLLGQSRPFAVTTADPEAGVATVSWVGPTLLSRLPPPPWFHVP